MLTRASTKKTAKPESGTPGLRLAVQYASEAADLPQRPMLRRWVKAALQQSAEITLRFVDSEEGAALNGDYRGKKGPTNVLSFLYTTQPLAGDIAICAPVVEQEAAAQGKALMAHYAHLVVHGVLHLQGWDHQSEAEADAMESRETAILQSLGFAAPYVMHNE